MYKMKEVCALTGLTEKTVRHYIQQQLILPKTEAGLHYRSYRFSDKDIRLLKQIAILRSVDFSIDQIRQMLADPHASPHLVAEKEAALAEKIAALQESRHTLSQLTVADQTNLAQITDAIEPQTQLRKETPKSSRNRFLWLGVYLIFFLAVGFLVTGGKQFWLMGHALAVLGGIEFPLKALRYFHYNRRHRKLEHKAQATIVSVVSDEGVGDYWEDSGCDILHGFLHLGFFHWSWICPDHWVPLVQFEAEGRLITSAYRYGGLRRSWSPGQICTVAWEVGKEQAVYPCNDPVLFRKTLWYFLGGVGMLLIIIGGAV